MIYSIRDLTILGAALYLGEGTRARKTKSGTIYSIEFTNTNPKMVKVFMLFLRKVIKPIEVKVKAQLFVYPDHNENNLKEHWSQELDIPLERFQKTIYLKQSSGRFKPSQFGIMKVRYNNKVHFLVLQGIIDKVFGGVA